MCCTSPRSLSRVFSSARRTKAGRLRLTACIKIRHERDAEERLQIQVSEKEGAYWDNDFLISSASRSSRSAREIDGARNTSASSDAR
jgi:hypothetical protein